jgi:hypothetical protein
MRRLLTGWILMLLVLPARPADDLAAVPESANAPATSLLYPDAPAFTIAPRTVSAKYYPCLRCHEFMEVDETARPLKAPHPKLKHGQARIWCLTCHNPKDQDTLRTLLDQPVPFADEHLVCAQCHAGPVKDWYFGAHGKRVANWQGGRELQSCSTCHNPHRPSLKPRAPEPPPVVRAGLERRDGQPAPVKPVWEQALENLPRVPLEHHDAPR